MRNNDLLGDYVYTRLASRYVLNLEEFVAPRLKNISLFEFIVAVMLSQNTNDRNAWRAYDNLKKNIGEITPGRIESANLEEVAESIKIAGMYKNRALRIKELAQIFRLNDIDKHIRDHLMQNNIEKAREMLLEIPGVGYKTADVVLLMYYGVPVFPVDTHIMRVTIRMGFAKRKDYDSISRFWATNTSPSNYLKLHLLLITHGRETCKARKPRCTNCVLIDLCSYGVGK
ncbi:MAG: endonuclease III [Desulfurococcaceae archaeon]